MQSTATASTYLSSMASSPRSYFDRNSSIFDRLEREEESSRPTSPESFALNSPVPFQKRSKSDDQALSVFEEEDFSLDDTPAPCAEKIALDSHSQSRPVTALQAQQEIYPEDDLTSRPSKSLRDEKPLELHQQETPTENGAQLDQSSTVQNESVSEDMGVPVPAETESKDAQHPIETVSQPSPKHQQVINDTSTIQSYMSEIRPSVRRSNSHDSLLSISGMDIHLAQNPRAGPSALRLLGTSAAGAKRHYFAPSPASLRQPLSTTVQPLASVTEFTATSRHNADAVSSSMQALTGMRGTAAQNANKGLIGTVGGWVSSKWGRAPTPMKSIPDLRSVAAHSPRQSISVPNTAPPLTPVKSSGASTISAGTGSKSIGKRSVSSNSDTPVKDTSASLLAASFMGRPPGINQSGYIPGFAAAIAAKRTPIVVVPQVDAQNLQESLKEI